MKKIMFDTKYGLEQAVIERLKTMTRRIIPLTNADKEYLDTAFDWDLRERVIIDRYAKYKVGEVVAVAQAYINALHPLDWVNREIYKNEKGWNNKMFVRADLMPHQIRITDIKVEHLRDISEEDAMREGVFKYDEPPLHHEMDLYAPWPPFVKPYKHDGDNLKYRSKARYAFAYLINKVSGRGTWESDPYVFAYSFELVK